MRRTTLLVTAMVVAATLVSGALVGDETASAQSATAVPGTTITVNSKGDGTKSGNCTLREAIEAANTNAKVDGCKAGSATERDAIRFAVGTKAEKKIVVGSHLPAISDPSGLNINGREASITISGNEQVRVFEVAAGAELALLNLTVADGRSAGGFGGAGRGGGLFSRGTVKVGNTTFSNNSAGSQGGGIFNDAGGTLTVTNTTLSENSASDTGGGIFNQEGQRFNQEGGTLTVTNSTFSNNSASSGFGGGLSNSSTAKVVNTTFSNNSSAAFGGGIFNFRGNIMVTNSTLSENSATRDGDGGGIFNRADATATLRNTIVANSTSGGNCAQPFGPIIDGGYNIDDGTTCGFSEQQDSLPSTDPRLADQPANNGGPTQTIALLKGSPAINAIPEAENGCGTEITTDQRGVSRPQGSGCDIGAYEKKVRSR